MSNRQVYPSSLFPLRGDVSAEAGATSVLVTGIQGTPINAGYSLNAYDTILYNEDAGVFVFGSPWQIPVGQVLEFEGYGYNPVGISWLASDTIAIGDGTQGDVSGAAAMTALILFGSPDYSDYDLFHTTIYSGATQNWSLILPENPGSSGQVLTTNGQGFTYWSTVTGGGGTPGGSPGDIQYNNSGAFGGSAATINAAGTITVPTSQVLKFSGSGNAGLSWIASDTLAVGNGTDGDVTGGLALTALILYGPSVYSAYDAFYTTIYSGATENWNLILPETPGSSGQVLATNGGGFTYWEALPSGFANPMTTAGDMIYESGGAPARLAIGSTGQVLATEAGIPTWINPGAISGLNATSIVGSAVSTNTPIEGDVMIYHQGTWQFQTVSPKMWAGWFKQPGTTTFASTLVGTLNTQSNWGIQQSLGSVAFADVAMTATEFDLMRVPTAATASTIAYGIAGDNGAFSTGIISLGILRRFYSRVRLNQTTNVRSWIGLYAPATGSGSNPVGAGATEFVSDTPTNIVMAAFRYSASTDSAWQAVTYDGTTRTVTSTGIAVDTTNTQLFEISWDGTSIYFAINGVLVATASAHLPATSVTFAPIITVDNKDTANTGSVDIGYMALELQK